MASDIPPAIVRDFNSQDKAATVHSVPYDGVSFRRGWGDSGYRIEVVEHDCPVCQFDRMVRRVRVSPEFQTAVRYWCLNPNCAHFVQDTVSHNCNGNYPQRSVTEPAVME